MASTEDGFTIEIDMLNLHNHLSHAASHVKVIFKKVKVLGAGGGAGGFDFTHSEPEPAQKCPAPQYW